MPTRSYRHTATFVQDWRPHSRPLDRNERTKILFLAEALERRRKHPGRRNGLLGYVGLQVLRCLLFGFLSARTGLCCPGYAAMMAKTGLCKASIAHGLARLERTGIVKIVRRLVRERVNRISPITGLPEQYVGTVQTSSLYSIHRPAPMPTPGTAASSTDAIPGEATTRSLERMELLWASKLSLRGRSNQTHRLVPSRPCSPWKGLEMGFSRKKNAGSLRAAVSRVSFDIVAV